MRRVLATVLLGLMPYVHASAVCDVALAALPESGLTLPVFGPLLVITRT